LRAVSAQVLRDGVLAGVAVRVAGAGELGDAVRSRLEALGAASSGEPDVLVVDGSGFDGMQGALDAAWDAIRPVATEAMIPGGGGRIVLLAPRPGEAVAAGTRAGLENLARTLSVEWARFRVRPVAILPGAATSPAKVAELVAFLASPAGEYYSGCAFELGGV
jgi:NAD(P)-dependent dehydrogenase (short-subunit alcohol dehydrogenase family)